MSTSIASDLFSNDVLEHPDDGLARWTSLDARVSNSQFPANATAQSLRIAARLNAAKISKDEHVSLLSERAKLIEKKYIEPSLTRQETARLEYVRWSLDRIEDAKHGHALDNLELAVSKYQEALDGLLALRGTLTGHLPKSRK